MLILLPPSETKRLGGRRRPVDLAALALPALTDERRRVFRALQALSADDDVAARVLKLSVRQRDDIGHNAALADAATMPAMDRFAGVLYDALDAPGLDAAARRWLGGHVLIQSALFGPVSAADPIPAYRLSAGARLPGLPALRHVWADAVTSALAARHPRFVLDLRSEAYAALGPVPAGVPTVYLRVVTEGPDGAVRALNHFNKHAKGALVRRLAEDRPRIGSVAGFRSWAARVGLELRDGAPGEVDLVTDAPAPVRRLAARG